MFAAGGLTRIEVILADGGLITARLFIFVHRKGDRKRSIFRGPQISLNDCMETETIMLSIQAAPVLSLHWCDRKLNFAQSVQIENCSRLGRTSSGALVSGTARGEARDWRKPALPTGTCAGAIPSGLIQMEKEKCGEDIRYIYICRRRHVTAAREMVACCPRLPFAYTRRKSR